MSSELTLDTKKRDKPCHPDCRHPICVRLKILCKNEKDIINKLQSEIKDIEKEAEEAAVAYNYVAEMLKKELKEKNEISTELKKVLSARGSVW